MSFCLIRSNVRPSFRYKYKISFLYASQSNAMRTVIELNEEGRCGLVPKLWKTTSDRSSSANRVHRDDRREESSSGVVQNNELKRSQHTLSRAEIEGGLTAARTLTAGLKANKRRWRANREKDEE